MNLRTQLLLLACCAWAGAQSLESTIDLSDGDPQTSDAPFGITLDPDGVHAYVALCGDLPPWPLPPAPWAPTWNNDKLIKIDLNTGAQVALATVGHYPEDIAITTGSSGTARHVYVSNSSSGTVTCLTPNLGLVSHIPLSSCFGATYGSSFPFGILASPGGDRVYVFGTGCGTVDVVDADPNSSLFNTVVETFSVPDLFGRPCWLNAQTLAVPVTRYNYNATLGYSDYSTTGFAVVDVNAPGTQSTWIVTPAQQFSYPQITDLAVAPDGQVLCPIGYGLIPEVVKVDPVTGVVTDTLDLSAHMGVGLHGAATSPDGATLAITSLNGGEVGLVEVAPLSLMWVTDTGTASTVNLPNEVVFTRDGSRLAVTLQGATSVQIYQGMPGFDLQLSAPIAVSGGTSGVIGVDAIQAGRAAWVYASDIPGPSTFGPWTAAIGTPFFLLTTLTGNAQGSASAMIQAPGAPNLVGQVFYLQAATQDWSGLVRLSGGRQTTIQ